MPPAQNGLVALIATGLIAAASVALIPLHTYVPGIVLIAMAGTAIVLLPPRARRDFSLAAGAIVLLALAPINTKVDWPHILIMGSIISAAVAAPYVISRYVFHDHSVTFPLHQGRGWYKTEIFYILFAGSVAYLLLPLYLRTTGSYHNWTVLPGFHYLALLFLGTNGLGLWDELFFVCTILALLRRHLPFWQANLAQALMWTAFLYELGFRGWGPLAVMFLALTQGYIFKRTASVLYIVSIHLTIDFILYLALIHAYYPDWLPIFLLK